MKTYLAFISINLKLAWRDRTVIFFNYLFPLFFLFTFAELNNAEQSGAINRVFASVLVIGILGNGFFGGGIRAVVDREMGILRRFKVAPISPLPILVASIVVGLATYLPAAIMIFLISHFRYGMKVPEQWPTLIAFLVIGIVTFRTVGLIVASVANSMAESQIIIQLLYFPMMFLSGATFPVGIFPNWLQTVVQFIPATYLFAGMQGILLQNENLIQVAGATAALIVAATLCLFISSKLFRWEKDEKLRPAAKFWILAVLLPFFVIGGVQAYSRGNITKAAEIDRQLSRSRSRLFKDVRVITGDGRVIERGAVLIREGKIAEVYEGAVPNEGGLKADIVEATGKTLIPGLIDLYVHVAMPGGVYEDPQDYQKSKLERVIEAYLYCGVTAVQSTGEPAAAIGDVRKRLDSAQLLAPDVYAGTPLIPTHKPLVNSPLMQMWLERMGGVKLPESPEAARVLVRDSKARFVFVSIDSLDNESSNRLVLAIGEEAKKRGLSLVARTKRVEDMRLAMRAGAAIIVRGTEGTPVPESVWAEMARLGVAFIPELSPMDALAAPADVLERSLVQQVVPAKLLAATKKIGEAQIFPALKTQGAGIRMGLAQMTANAVSAHRAGVRLLAGTGAGDLLVFHGPALHHELQAWVRGGIPAAVALRAATADAAQALGAGGKVGRIAPGLDATMLLLDGNPLTDITATERISLVIFKGERVVRSELFDQQ